MARKIYPNVTAAYPAAKRSLPLSKDYYELSSSEQSSLMTLLDQTKYNPRDTTGRSTARSFWYALQTLDRRKPTTRKAPARRQAKPDLFKQLFG